MPSAEKTRTTQETWADWIKDINPDYDENHDDYVTIDELVEELNRFFAHRNAEINPSTIRYWQTQGLIPYPLKRWVNGVTRALYPSPLAFRVMLHLRQLQLDRGYSLDQLKEAIRPLLKKSIAEEYEPSEYNLELAILAAARHRETITKRRVTHVDVTFFDASGPVTQRYDIPDEQEIESANSDRWAIGFK